MAVERETADGLPEMRTILGMGMTLDNVWGLTLPMRGNRRAQERCYITPARFEPARLTADGVERATRRRCKFSPHGRLREILRRALHFFGHVAPRDHLDQLQRLIEA